MKKTVAVIGAGAAGMMAAIQAAMCGAKVLLIERNDRVGKKILSTGNGKCNFSHRQIQVSDYYGSFAPHGETYFGQFGVEDTLAFFEDNGMFWKDKNGYLYPYSEQAATVLDVLRFSLERLGVEVLLSCKADRFLKNASTGLFEIYAGKEKVASCQSLILAGGGKAAPATGSDGQLLDALKASFQIASKEPVPALTKLVCSDSYCKALQGVRSEAKVTLWEGKKQLATEEGEVQFTEYGLSGIPIFQFSRLVTGHKGLICSLDFFKALSEQELLERLLHKVSLEKNVPGDVFLTGFLHKKLAGELGKQAGIKYSDVLSKKDEATLYKLAKLSKNFVFHVVDVKGFEQAQTTAGGVLYSEVTDQLESYKVPGLFFAGEILDMDGKCGGYNLQWAWTSGAIAGKAAALKLGGRQN